MTCEQSSIKLLINPFSILILAIVTSAFCAILFFSSPHVIEVHKPVTSNTSPEERKALILYFKFIISTDIKPPHYSGNNNTCPARILLGLERLFNVAISVYRLPAPSFACAISHKQSPFLTV